MKFDNFNYFFRFFKFFIFCVQGPFPHQFRSKTGPRSPLPIPSVILAFSIHENEIKGIFEAFLTTSH